MAVPDWQQKVKTFYAQVVDPKGGEYSDGTSVPINRRYFLPFHNEEVKARFGEALLVNLAAAKPGEQGDFYGVTWTKEV